MPLTRPTRPIWSAWWAYDGRHLVYLDDTDIDENWRTWSVEREGGEPRRLTPERRVSAHVLAPSPDRPDLAAVAGNDHHPAWHDAGLVDAATGEHSLALANRDRHGGYAVEIALSLRLLTDWEDERGSGACCVGRGRFPRRASGHPDGGVNTTLISPRGTRGASAHGASNMTADPAGSWDDNRDHGLLATGSRSARAP